MNLHVVLPPLQACLAAAILLLVLAVGATTSLPRSHSLGLYSDGASPLLSLPQPRPRPPREVSNELEKKARKMFRKQVRLLQRLKCKPKSVKIPVMQYIGGDNEILDWEPHPEVVVVKRCENACSYCGDPLGFESQACEPESAKNKTFAIFYRSGRGQGIHMVRVPVHKKCVCR